MSGYRPVVAETVFAAICALVTITVSVVWYLTLFHNCKMPQASKPQPVESRDNDSTNKDSATSASDSSSATNEPPITMPKSLKITSFISLAANCFYGVGFICFYLYPAMHRERPCGLQFTSSVSSFLQRTFLYLYFVLRMKFTFRGSMFSFRPWVYKLLFVLLGISLFLNILGTLITSVFNDCKPSVPWFVAFSVSFDMVLAILMLSLFINRLRMVYGVLQWRATQADKDTMEDDVPRLGRKIATLAVLTMSSTFFAYLVMIITQSEAIFALETTMSAICLVFTFSFFDGAYHKYCRLCDKCCVTCCCNIRSVKMHSTELKIAQVIANSPTPAEPTASEQV